MTHHYCIYISYANASEIGHICIFAVEEQSSHSMPWYTVYMSCVCIYIRVAMGGQ